MFYFAFDLYDMWYVYIYINCFNFKCRGNAFIWPGFWRVHCTCGRRKLSFVQRRDESTPLEWTRQGADDPPRGAEDVEGEKESLKESLQNLIWINLFWRLLKTFQVLWGKGLSFTGQPPDGVARHWGRHLSDVAPCARRRCCKDPGARKRCMELPRRKRALILRYFKI